MYVLCIWGFGCYVLGGAGLNCALNWLLAAAPLSLWRDFVDCG